MDQTPDITKLLKAWTGGDPEAAPEVSSGSRDREIVAIIEALDALAAIDPRKAKVVELRFLGR